MCVCISKLNMTIDEIKSVSIRQYLEVKGFNPLYLRKGNYWYLSPLRNESQPSFSVNPDKNLWNDFGEGKGGNLINLYQTMNPGKTNHEVLSELEAEIKKHGLIYAVDYEAEAKAKQEKQDWIDSQIEERERQKDANTVVDRICDLSHPYLRDYILQRRVDYDVAKQYCQEVHYSIYDKHYYAIAFRNIEGGMEARNKYSKRSIGLKSISIIRSDERRNRHCCVFEGFFNMLTYVTMKKWNIDYGICIDDDCDYFVLNSVSNLKTLLPYLSDYEYIHCYLDNDVAGVRTMNKIVNNYPGRTFDESVRYKSYNDLNDVINGKVKPNN